MWHRWVGEGDSDDQRLHGHHWSMFSSSCTQRTSFRTWISTVCSIVLTMCLSMLKDFKYMKMQKRKWKQIIPNWNKNKRQRKRSCNVLFSPKLPVYPDMGCKNQKYSFEPVRALTWHHVSSFFLLVWNRKLTVPTLSFLCAAQHWDTNHEILCWSSQLSFIYWTLLSSY